MSIAREHQLYGNAVRRWEPYLVHLTAAVGIPAITFFTAWWFSAALLLNTDLPISEAAIKYTALTGLAAGIIADCVVLRYIGRAWYTVHPAVPVAVYLYFSTITYALLMGLPAGVFFMGILAGIYTGRRLSHNMARPAPAHRQFTTTAVMTAALTGGFTLTSAILALNEPAFHLELAHMFGLPETIISRGLFTGLMITAVPLSAVVQYHATKYAARWSYSL